MTLALKPKNSWIQILRALSVLVVIAYHFDLPIPNGFIGVDIFFVISGYVITQSLIRSREHSWISVLKLFYVKRIARLFPAFLVVFISTIIASVLFLSPNMGVQQNAIKSSLGATLGISNYVIPRATGDYFGAQGNTNPFLHTWSLSVEEQFYFLFPFVFIILIRNRVKLGSYISSIVLLSVLAIFSYSLVLPLVGFEQISNLGTTQYFAPQNRAWQFLAGVITAVLPSARFELRHSHKVKILVLLSGSMTLICVSKILSFQESLYQTILPVTLASIFLFVSDKIDLDFSIPSKTSRCKDLLVTIGDWSYSLYLWHWPIWIFTKLFFSEYKVLHLTMALALTFTLSALTYKFVETRFNFGNNAKVGYWIKFFLMGQVIAILLFFLAFQGVSKGWGQDWALNSHKVMREQCDEGVTSKEKCVWGSKANSRIVIVGDSMSWAVADPIIDLGLEKGLSVKTYTKNGCPAGLPMKLTSDCEKWQKFVSLEISQNAPELVVVANADSDNVEIKQNLNSFLGKMFQMKIPTLVILAPPGGDENSGRKALMFSPGLMNRSSERPNESKFQSEVKSVVEKYPAMGFFDPADVLCDPKCKIAVNGREVYNYGRHLSVFGALLLTNELNSVIDNLINYSSDSKTNKASM